MLYTYAVPTPLFVYDCMMANVGDMENTGVEMMFNIGVIRNKELDWTMTLNGSYNKNKITRPHPAPISTPRDSRIVQGIPAFSSAAWKSLIVARPDPDRAYFRVGLSEIRLT